MRNETLAVLLLAVILIGLFVLTALGVLSKSEMLPIVGGCVVVSHRLIAVIASGKGGPPGSGASIGPLVGMLVGLGLAQVLGTAGDMMRLSGW